MSNNVNYEKTSFTKQEVIEGMSQKLNEHLIHEGIDDPYFMLFWENGKKSKKQHEYPYIIVFDGVDKKHFNIVFKSDKENYELLKDMNQISDYVLSSFKHIAKQIKENECFITQNKEKVSLGDLCDAELFIQPSLIHKTDHQFLFVDSRGNSYSKEDQYIETYLKTILEALEVGKPIVNVKKLKI